MKGKNTMILDRLEHIHRYRSLGENFSKAIDYLVKTDVFSLPLGEIEIDGRDLYGFTKETLLTHENQRWEAHRLYADIQLILDGAERIAYTPFDNQPVSEAYNAEKDVLFYSESGSGLECSLGRGDFMVFMPGELHRPDCPIEGHPLSRKLVVKIRMG